MKKALDTVFRVVRLSAPLRDELRRAREAKGTTSVAFIGESVAEQLPKLVETLQNLGFLGAKGSRRPARLPFSSEAGTLKALQAASQKTGIPASHLLTACLFVTTQAPPAKRGRQPRGNNTHRPRKREEGS